MQQLPSSADAFVWLRLYQVSLGASAPSGADDPLWWTNRKPLRPLTYHAARAMFTRADHELGANWSLHDLRHTATYRFPARNATAHRPTRRRPPRHQHHDGLPEKPSIPRKPSTATAHSCRQPVRRPIRRQVANPHQPDDVRYAYFQDPADGSWRQLALEHASGLGRRSVPRPPRTRGSSPPGRPAGPMPSGRW